MRSISLLVAASLVGLPACDSMTNVDLPPLLVVDTVEVFAPLPSNSGVPTALDVGACGGQVGGARFPERLADAGNWDFAIRLRGGEFFFEPAALFEVPSRAAITRPLAGETMVSLIEAPATGSFLADTAVVVQKGAVYAARSRDLQCGFAGGQMYSKLQVLETDPATGLVRLHLVTNERFSDLRLALKD